jgi:ribonuclease HI
MAGADAGVALRGSKGEVLHYALHLLFPITNNTAEYEAIIAGL